MTSEGVLRLVLAAADDVGRVFDHTDLAEWPAGLLEEVLALGILRPSAGGLTAVCPSCDDRHVEIVRRRAGPDGEQRLFIYCPEQLRVEVTADMCRGWEIDPAGLAAAVARAMSPRGTASEVVRDRMWRVGRLGVGGTKRAVVLARRMGEGDAASIANHVGPGGRQIVLVPSRAPDDRVWPGAVPAVIRLADIASIEDGLLRLDHESTMATIREADGIAEAGGLLPVDPEVKKQVVRQQVKAEIKGHLEDDVLVAAYVAHGSYRKAAAALTEQTGEPVTTDKVQRAVERRGGIAEVMADSDTPSVARTVASQRRDRQKKVLTYR